MWKKKEDREHLSSLVGIGSILNKVFKEGLHEKMTFEQ